MLNYQIAQKRDELNKSIEQGQDYSITYKISVELDELIAKYYKQLNEQENRGDKVSTKTEIFAKI